MQVKAEWMGGPDDGSTITIDSRAKYIFVAGLIGGPLWAEPEDLSKLSKRTTYAVPIELSRNKYRLMWYKKQTYESGPL